MPANVILCVALAAGCGCRAKSTPAPDTTSIGGDASTKPDPLQPGRPPDATGDGAPAGPGDTPEPGNDTSAGATGSDTHRPLIVCFGDSLTAGYGASEGHSYPDYLQHDLDHDGFRYRVLNEGVSGATSKDGVDRLGQIVGEHPALVVLEFGGNDGLRGFQTSVTRANLSKMIAALKAAGIKVVLAGIILPPDYGADYVKSFTGNYTALAAQYKLPVLPFLLKDVYGVPGMMQADRTHATDKGNEVVAHNVLPLVEPLLHK